MKVFTGACSEAAMAMPYLPFLEALGNYVARADLQTLRAGLGRSATALGNLFPRLGPSPVEAGDPNHAKLRLFEGILQLLELVAAKSGLLLVIEDLHGADASTRELIDYLARRVQGTRMLVLVTYRAEELGRSHPLLHDLQAWRRNALAQVMELKSLDVQEVASVVEAILDEPGSPEVGKLLHERSEGNPFVIEELIKEALEAGDIFRTERGWERKELSELRLPRTVRDTILLRLDRLSPDQVGMLRAAAVLGDRFTDATLIAVAGQDLRAIREALRACVQHQLLREEAHAGGTYHFRHSLTRDAVYEDLVSTERQEYHSRAADALSNQPGSGAVDIARHLIAAGRTDEAVPVCLQTRLISTKEPCRTYTIRCVVPPRSSAWAPAFCMPTGPVRRVRRSGAWKRRSRCSTLQAARSRRRGCVSPLPTRTTRACGTVPQKLSCTGQSQFSSRWVRARSSRMPTTTLRSSASCRSTAPRALPGRRRRWRPQKPRARVWRSSVRKTFSASAWHARGSSTRPSNGSTAQPKVRSRAVGAGLPWRP